jgi:hypothetical protein
MAIRRDSPLGRAVLASRSRPPLLRIALSPRLARFLIAAGAQPAPVDESMSVEFKPGKGEPDPSPGQDPGSGSIADTSSEGSEQPPAGTSRPEEYRWREIAAELVMVVTKDHLTNAERVLVQQLVFGVGTLTVQADEIRLLLHKLGVPDRAEPDQMRNLYARIGTPQYLRNVSMGSPTFALAMAVSSWGRSEAPPGGGGLVGAGVLSPKLGA